MGSYKWGYKSPNLGYKYSYPTYSPTYNYLLEVGPGLAKKSFLDFGFRTVGNKDD